MAKYIFHEDGQQRVAAYTSAYLAFVQALDDLATGERSPMGITVADELLWDFRHNSINDLEVFVNDGDVKRIEKRSG